MFIQNIHFDLGILFVKDKLNSNFEKFYLIVTSVSLSKTNRFFKYFDCVNKLN